MEVLLLMAVMPLLLIAPIAEAWERWCERRRAGAEAREQALACQRTWMRLYGPVPGAAEPAGSRGAGAGNVPARGRRRGDEHARAIATAVKPTRDQRAIDRDEGDRACPAASASVDHRDPRMTTPARPRPR